jgi:hypothetical protein
MAVSQDSTHTLYHATHLHARFLALLPKIELHGQIFFRYLKCLHSRQEAIAEMVALAWKWFLNLAERGKDASQFPSALATFAARAVYNGRRVCGMDPGKDVLSPRAQRRHRFTTGTLREGRGLDGTLLEEALHDNTQTPVDEQVCFRLDFPAWLLTRSDRDCRMVLDLMRGERTLDVSRKYGTTPGRISQLRRDFHEDWSQFCGEQDEDGHTGSG